MLVRIIVGLIAGLALTAWLIVFGWNTIFAFVLGSGLSGAVVVYLKIKGV